MKHLILGNGAAGITAAEKIRELADLDEITIISSEDTTVYTKSMLPDYIGGRLHREKLFIRDADSYFKNRINLVTGDKAQKIDVAKKEVTLESGAAESYDKLLIAVGSVPIVPPIEGLEGINYFTINTLKSADEIKKEASKGGNAIIIGAGLSGIEVGFALKRLGMEVCIIEREERILPLQLDDYSSSILVEEVRRNGITFLLGKTARKVLSDASGAGSKGFLELSDGRKIAFNLLAITVGTKPDIELIRDTGIKYNRGVLVDEYMRTSVEDIYAAGDVAETTGELSGELTCRYIWSNAMSQGKCAAFNMIGQKQIFEANLLNPIQLRDIPFTSMGLLDPKGNGHEIITSYDKEKDIYKRLVLENNILKGMAFLGDQKTANLVSGLIRKAVDISESKNEILGSR